MSWRQRISDWIAPKATEAAGQVGEAVGEAKDRIVVIAQQKTGLPVKVVLFLLTLGLLLLGVGGYGIYWRYFRPVKPPAALVPVQTQGGEKTPGYAALPVKKLAGVARRTTQRPVQSTPVADLPAKEQGYAPVVAPAAGPDNVVRTEPELLTSSVVPPARGDTEVRTWLRPDGSAQNVLTPQREDYIGWPWKGGNWKRIELDGGYGVGGKQVDAQATWLPLRMGNFQVGARVEAWTDPLGGVKGTGSIRVRWEPFRSQYR